MGINLQLLSAMKLWQVAIVPKELIIHNFKISKEHSLLLSFFSLCNSILVYPFRSFPFLDSKLKSDNLSKLPLEEPFIEF